MAFFFSIALFIGGVASPTIFALFISQKSKLYISYAYIFSGLLMILASFIVYLYGVNAENKSLEELV